MQLEDRIVVSTPITELWNDTGALDAQRMGDVSCEAVKAMLSNGPVQFVVASTGAKLMWIKPTEAFSFWKNELRQHLYSSDKKYLEDYPDDYFYFASEWKLGSAQTIIVLEKHD